MSRVGRQIINIPQGVEITQESDGRVKVSGPKGDLERRVGPEVKVIIEDGTVSFQPQGENVKTRALWGTYAAHVANMVKGVVTPFERKLVVEGVGYKVQMEGNELVLSVGYSHPVRLPVPQGLTVEVEKNVISVSGIDKEQVGFFAGKVKAVKKPDPYKGKGIRYKDETVRIKQGKKSA